MGEETAAAPAFIRPWLLLLLAAIWGIDRVRIKVVGTLRWDGTGLTGRRTAHGAMGVEVVPS